MLVLRLARTGRAKYPTYRIVAAESARAATGRFVSVLGHYNPHTKDFTIKREEAEKYLANGAQPSPSVVKLLQREGVELPKWVKIKAHAPKPAAAAAVAGGAADGAEDASDEPDVTPEEAAAEAPEVEGDDTVAGEGADAAGDEEEVRVGIVASEHANEIEGNQPAETNPADSSAIQTVEDMDRLDDDQAKIDAAAEEAARNAADKDKA